VTLGFLQGEMPHGIQVQGQSCILYQKLGMKEDVLEVLANRWIAASNPIS
jgi:hypothetical protein